jgi:hypothetical protein
MIGNGIRLAVPRCSFSQLINTGPNELSESKKMIVSQFTMAALHVKHAPEFMPFGIATK